mmetsp:Transcript_26189/g.71861  ORF Transcript_26189/g.71861 Transcript_26189/m.71861 type:complete len:434 (+) Transcript_26189:81-1382(+)
MMARNANLLFLLLGCSDMFGASALSQLVGNVERQNERILVDMMMPGDRVSSIDRSAAICAADSIPDQGAEMKRTVVDYYYAIQSTEKITTSDSTGRSVIRMLENKLFRLIRPAILWCYFDESQGTRRNLLRGEDHFRRLTLEEARRQLSVVSVGNSPEDEATNIDCNFETNDSENCIVIHGMFTIMHHATSDVSLAVASLYDSTQKAMDNSEILLPLNADENIANITNIKWLGETEEDAKFFFGVISKRGVVLDQANSEVNEEEEDDDSPLVYMAVPLFLLLLLALFMTRRKKRKIVTRGQLHLVESFDDVLIGTGDPPGSFHEGMYHYTCEGGRYLSTNCAGCIETKRNDFYTANDLETISENSMEDDDYSSYRKKHLVAASESMLGKKHSSIDVHNCSSANCEICSYQPRDVQFISKSEDLESLESGETEV